MVLAKKVSYVSAKIEESEKQTAISRGVFEGRIDFDVPEAEIFNEMAEQKFSQEETERALSQLSQIGVIYNPTSDRWRLAR